MALEELTKDLSDLSLADPECVPFQPTGRRSYLQGRFTNIPRYLFRVFTPNSAGETGKFWTKSRHARHRGANHGVDIFARKDDECVADTLNQHLRWWEGDEQNFVSWTSSLLLALQYIFYLHRSEQDGSAFDDINLCIIDTNMFPRGVFIRDMDLVQTYCKSSLGFWRLEGLKTLRSKQHRLYRGSYYFGEYLSQGALRIEGKCDIVSAEAMIDRGLFCLQPKAELRRHPWADEVIRLREVFYKKATARQEMDEEELKAAVDISRLFEQRWRLPMAANLYALRPRRQDDHITPALSHET